MLYKKQNQNVRILVLLAFCINAMVQGQPTPPADKSWKEVPMLTDDFESWDETKWYKELWNYPAPVSMQAKNSGVSNGKLWIKASVGDDPERWFETCRIYSKTRIKYPMYTECRIKTAHISAFNTFWLNKGDGISRDEIDICENVSNPSDPSFSDWPYTMHSQYFIVKDGVEERRKANFDNRRLSDDNAMKGLKWNEEFHTLGLWWKDANNLQFYINGEEAGNVTSTKDFTMPLNIIWDLWTSPEDWFCGLALKRNLSNDSINTMYVDWIKTYSLVDSPVDITEMAASQAVIVFPNPVSQRLTIVLPADFKMNSTYIRISNITGKLMTYQRLSSQRNQLSTYQFPSGVYWILVSDGERTSRQCIVKY